MNILQYAVFVGAAVNILGSLSYARDTIAGKTKPNKISWFLWAAAPIIGAAAAFSKGVGWAALPVFMAGFCPLLIFISSFFNKKSYWKPEPLDYVCGALSILALILWLITKQPLIAIIFAIASDGMAALPTLIKSFKFPETESGLAYLTGLFNAATSFLAIKIWTPTEYAFPLYLVTVCTLLSLAVYRPQIKAVFVKSVSE